MQETERPRAEAYEWPEIMSRRIMFQMRGGRQGQLGQHLGVRKPGCISRLRREIILDIG